MNPQTSPRFPALDPAGWSVAVDPDAALRPIKPMNAVNNGPAITRTDQTRGNFDEFKALDIPCVRTHDAAHCGNYGGHHCGDITSMFPDFDADETDPANYDFTCTDEYLQQIEKAGSRVFFRLGQSIEHWIKKYGVNPPKDFAKWARICEHVIRHYNEGWAGGFHMGIKHWEIWNEPDGNGMTADGRQGPTWTGTDEQFLELYKATATHLKRRFPALKIGGPAFCWWGAWKDKFLPFCRRENVPLDFYSWHRYYRDANDPVRDAMLARRLLDENGFTKTESILNEWNYVRGWTDEWIHSLACMSGEFNQKGAASIAAVMIGCQAAPLDMLMYYDARVGCGMNGMFDPTSLLPLRGYYPFVAWRDLRRLGTEVATRCDEGGATLHRHTPDNLDENHDGVRVPELFATAARNDRGDLGIFVARYSDDNNIVATRRVTLALPKGRSFAGARCHLTDSCRIHTGVDLLENADGTVAIKMQPNSFAYVEVSG